MKLLRNLTLSIVGALALFLFGGAWLVHEREARVVAAAQPQPVTAPTASQARAVCREFIDRRIQGTVYPVQSRDWRVKAPGTDSNRWQVVTEFVQEHGSGVATRHRMLCVIDFTEGTGWTLARLV